MKVELTKVSTRGQVVIPRNIRDALGIGPGSRFVVYVDGGDVVLRKLEVPSSGASKGKIGGGLGES